MKKWYEEPGEQNDVVLSTRVRLARNLFDYVFPSRLDAAGRAKVIEEIKSAVFEDFSDLSFVDMSTLSRLQAISLAERHVITPEFVSEKAGRGLIVSEDESIGIMLCEEDHIKLQVVKSGLALEEAYEVADSIDSALDRKLNYAFDEKIGYLTSCPTNLGTAMRASVLIHLPALTACGQISRLANMVSKLGLNISGAYGSRSQPLGDIYTISNQITLGITEETAISNLKSIVLQLVSQEKSAAERVLKNPSEEDKIYRSLGVLQNARLVGTNEFMELISSVRFGAANGLIDIPMDVINTLIIEMQPATISAADESIDSVSLRDAARAKSVREALKR